MKCAQILTNARLLSEDNIHGSTWITRKLGELAVQAENAGCLDDVVRMVMQGHGGLVQVRNLGRKLLDTAQGTARDVVRTFQQLQRQGMEKAVNEFREFVKSRHPTGGILVATISDSSAVRAALDAVADKIGSVVVGESRPMLEGRSFAQWAVSRGFACTMVIDAALFTMARNADAILLGCDAVMTDGFVNKVGSSMLVDAAQHCNIPVFVMADPTKIIEKTDGYTIKSGPASEVWDKVPDNVEVLNPYLETVNLNPVVRILGLF